MQVAIRLLRLEIQDVEVMDQYVCGTVVEAAKGWLHPLELPSGRRARLSVHGSPQNWVLDLANTHIEEPAAAVKFLQEHGLFDIFAVAEKSDLLPKKCAKFQRTKERQGRIPFALALDYLRSMRTQAAGLLNLMTGALEEDRKRIRAAQDLFGYRVGVEVAPWTALNYGTEILNSWLKTAKFSFESESKTGVVLIAQCHDMRAAMSLAISAELAKNARLCTGCERWFLCDNPLKLFHDENCRNKTNVRRSRERKEQQARQEAVSR